MVHSNEMIDPSQYFEGTVARVNDYLHKMMPPEDALPDPIHRAMRYSMFAGGKRMRPLLCILVTEALDKDSELVLPLAASIEMIHTYSLIHDDLPSMDNDDLRRGKPTNHIVFGEAIAILAGDALLTLAFETLAGASFDPDIRCRLIAALSGAAGTHGMIGGQVLDIRSESRILTRVDLEKMHGMKTAALIGYSAVAPAMAFQSGKDTEQAFLRYGESIGLAFQIVDDLLDVEGDSRVLGKTAGKDRQSEKATYPSLIGIEESRQLAHDLIQNAVDGIAQYDRRGYLEAYARFVLHRKM